MQKRYEDRNRLFKEFQVGGQVYLCIKPQKNSFLIGSCTKLALQCCGPFRYWEDWASRLSTCTTSDNESPWFFSTCHFLRGMFNMLITWLTGLNYSWNEKDNSTQNDNLYCRERWSCLGTEKLSRLRSNGITLGLMKLHQRLRIKCRLYILPYLLVEQMF